MNFHRRFIFLIGILFLLFCFVFAYWKQYFFSSTVYLIDVVISLVWKHSAGWPEIQIEWNEMGHSQVPQRYYTFVCYIKYIPCNWWHCRCWNIIYQASPSSCGLFFFFISSLPLRRKYLYIKTSILCAMPIAHLDLLILERYPCRATNKLIVFQIVIVFLLRPLIAMQLWTVVKEKSANIQFMCSID